TTGPPTTAPPTVPADSGPYDILVANPDQFGTLVSLIDRVGLDEDLTTPGASFTVFAPTNEAFEGLDLAALSDDDVRDLLLHHVTDDAIDSELLFSESGEVETFNGTIFVDADTQTVSGASVLFADLEGTGDPNGFVHGIDQVLLP
ncbi:MAG: hypothetical protein CL424_09225, partial [Acidimicrobiaceae bacterium]|nr:hypothetical protein [Acidimicrobiaceae bacterium]